MSTLKTVKILKLTAVNIHYDISVSPGRGEARLYICIFLVVVFCLSFRLSEWCVCDDFVASYLATLYTLGLFAS